jgi:hypothetical protein
MAVSTWLRTFRKLKSSARRERLLVESLEDRWLPSVATSTALSDSAGGVPTYGQNVTLTASVTSTGSTVSTGTVDFSTGGVLLAGGVPVDSSGHASFSTTRFPAGLFPIVASYNDASSTFGSSSGNESLNVARATLTITAANQSMAYGGTPPTLTVASYAGFVNGDTTATLGSPVDLTTTATAQSPVGSYSIDPSAPPNHNYVYNYVAGTFTITPVTLTITASNQGMIYGAPLPTLTVASYVGFVNGDTAASLTTPVKVTSPATSSSPVGSYPTNPSGAADPNYTITYVPGALTITQDSTTTVLSGPPAFVPVGQSVSLQASVTPGVSATSSATGSVTFSDGATLLATVPLTHGATTALASLDTSALPLGVHSLTATYLGDANHIASTSSVFTLTVGTASGVASGTVFRDFNGNGVQDPGEPGIAGQTVFFDLDGSGQLTPADPSAVTDANGNYQLTAFSPGTYTVRQLLLGGALPSAPANNSYQVALAAGANAAGQNFADVLTSIAVPLTLAPTSPFPKQGTANADYVEALYRAVLNRDADAGGLASWTNQLNKGSLTRLQVVQDIRNSTEHFTQEVSDFYMTLLNRQPDASGLQNWVQHLQSGMKEEQIAFDFLDSPEYLSHGDKHFVDAMYQSLLGRSFDTAGEANWLSQLGDDASGKANHPASMTHEQVIAAFLYSTESETRLTEGYYEVFLQRPADAAGLNGWLGNLQRGSPFLSIGQQFLSSDEFYNRAGQQG